MMEEAPNRYTCNEYRMEMVLLSLQRRINHPDTPEEEKKSLAAEIERIQIEMGMV